VVPFARSALAFASLPLLSGLRSLLPVRATCSCPDSALSHLGFAFPGYPPERRCPIQASAFLYLRTFPLPCDIPCDATPWWPVSTRRLSFRFTRIAAYFSFHRTRVV
jgi:hypothetical protein